MIEETTISYEPLDDEENPHPIPQDAKEFYHDFYKIASQNPEFAIKKSLENIEKYPDVPAFYNHLHAAYCLASYKYEAIRLVKEMIQQFPNYLFARIEYAHYFLRRGEPDNAYDALGNKGTLAQLYPERTVFHISELRYFSYVMALYHIQKGDIDQAKIYLEVIKKAEPNNHHMIKSLHKKFMRVLMPKFMDNLKKN
jgi:tetratricopeptide (TPR) repeat protein